MFINLFNRSHYTLLRSLIKIDDLIAYATMHQQTAVCLVDQNVLFGAMELYVKAKQHHLRPIIGLEITYQNAGYVLIAKNFTGWQMLNKISSMINTNTAFDLAQYLDQVFVINLTDYVNPTLVDRCCDYYTVHGQQPIAIKLSTCINPSDQRYLPALTAIRESKLMDEIKEQYQEQFLYDDATAQTHFSATAIQNLTKLIDQVDWVIPEHLPINFVQFNPQMNAQKNLADLAIAGLKAKNIDPDSPQYHERLMNELNVINQMGFNDYFLVVADYVKWANDHAIMVGPGRGSAVGSLVAYALNITSIDPLQYHLLFERFLNVNRATMPDIDIDFQDDRRNEVVQYLFTRYPNTQVAHIIIFQKIKAKMALRDAGRVLNVNKSIIDLISKTIDSFDERRIGAMLNDNPALKEYQQKYPDLFNLADQLCGLVRQIGLHAAGMVISESGLGTLVPVFLNDGVVSTQFSMEYLEMLGIIKVDLLGLINLTIIQKTLDLIKNVNHHQLTCATIPLDDLTTFKYISTGKTDGIFQLASPPMRNILKRLQPRNIEDISTVIALYRPGALKYINELIDHRRNPQKIQYLKPSFAPILSFTYGIVIYQEQLMDLIRLAGNYSYAQADIFRRIITKKKPQELIKLRDDFMAKTIANGYAKEDAQQIFQFIENFAGYGFNHSHSIAYAYISYWMVYLKVHYSLAYFAVLLTTVINDATKLTLYIADARSLNVQIAPPSILHSQNHFMIIDNQLYYPLNALPGVSNLWTNKIIPLVEKHPGFDALRLIMVLAKAKISIDVIQTLLYAGAFDTIITHHSRYYYIYNLAEIYQKSHSMTVSGELLIQPQLVDVQITPEIQKELTKKYHELVKLSEKSK